MLLRLLATIFMVCGFISVSEAVTFYRLPIPYVPYRITAWRDATPKGDSITRRYDGINISPSSSYFYDGHRGTDFAAPYGTAVYAATRGTVYSTNNTCDPNGGYIGNPCGHGWGRYVAIKDADNIVSIHAHLSSVSVTSSSVVCVSGPGGTRIGYSGNSGSSGGAHVHFELRLNDLSASSPGYDPFGGSASTQSWDRWYDWAWVPDPLRSGYNMHYPVTTCQP